MERTESTVVQVAPDYENAKIQEMQLFGWNLQGRQEIEQQGEAYGRPSYMAEFTGTYVVKTIVHRFVKLHFVRSLSMPNLDAIRRLETEYASLPFPGPASLKGPGCFTAFFAIGFLPALGMLGERPAEGLLLLAAYGLLVALGVYWLNSRRRKNQQIDEVCRQSATRADQILAEVRALDTQVSG